jgi:glycosyltransferase involved in cell wall biosynthesis
MTKFDARDPTSQDGLLSVVMPVHNAGPYLDEAIESILNQSYRDFEFVILDDGSTDGSAEKLREWAARDDRIKLHRQEQNSGPVESSNLVVHHASGALIARMDADDRSHPERLKRQVDLLKKQPEIGLVGSLCNVIDRRGRIVRGPDVWRLDGRSWFTPFPHGSIMYRRDLFHRAGGYRKACVYWEDQDLFLRMSALTNIVTIPLPLYEHRQSPLSTRLVSQTEFVEGSIDLAYRCLNRLREGHDYESLLREGRRSDRIDPRVFVSLGSLQLWAGQRPSLFGRMLKGADLRPNFKSLSALVWALWAWVSPGSLRVFMRQLSNFRNARVRDVPKETAVPWVMPGNLAEFEPASPTSERRSSVRQPH